MRLPWGLWGPEKRGALGCILVIVLIIRSWWLCGNELCRNGARRRKAVIIQVQFGLDSTSFGSHSTRFNLERHSKGRRIASRGSHGIVYLNRWFWLTPSIFKYRIDKFWKNKDMVRDYKSDLTGIGNRSLNITWINSYWIYISLLFLLCPR